MSAEGVEPSHLVFPHWRHASCVVIGESGILIEGPSGSGKSSLASTLITEARQRGQFGSWVADDRILIKRAGNRLIAAPHPRIAGHLEARGIGILTTSFEAKAVVRLVVDLRGRIERMPGDGDLATVIAGVRLRCLPLVAGSVGLYEVRLVLDVLRMHHRDEDGLTSVSRGREGWCLTEAR